MKRSYETSYNIIPNDVFGIIHQHLSAESKSALSQVDKFQLKVCSHLATDICFLPPKELSNTPDNIYPGLIARFPNIRKITFESYYQEDDEKIFQKQVRALINFLSKNKDKHPLSHVKEMDIREVRCGKMPALKDLENINLSFLSALSHPGLESIIWRTFNGSTPLHSVNIQPILEKAVNLKHFQIHGLFQFLHINLSFKNQSELASVLFNSGLNASAKTIKSLSQCENLEKLATGYHYFTADSIEKIFNSSTWNLKHLTLTIPSKNADLSFTKQMHLLESLTILSGHPSTSLINLGTNCPNLRELRIEKLTLEDEKIAKMLQGLSKLEVFIFKSPHAPTEIVLESLNNNCPLLDAHQSQSTITAWKQWTYFSSKNTMPTFS